MFVRMPMVMGIIFRIISKDLAVVWHGICVKLAVFAVKSTVGRFFSAPTVTASASATYPAPPPLSGLREALQGYQSASGLVPERNENSGERNLAMPRLRD